MKTSEEISRLEEKLAELKERNEAKIYKGNSTREGVDFKCLYDSEHWNSLPFLEICYKNTAEVERIQVYVTLKDGVKSFEFSKEGA
jgi:hypothetical protein